MIRESYFLLFQISSYIKGYIYKLSMVHVHVFKYIAHVLGVELGCLLKYGHVSDIRERNQSQ